MGLIGDEYEDRVTGERGKGDAVDDCTSTAASAAFFATSPASSSASSSDGQSTVVPSSSTGADFKASSVAAALDRRWCSQSLVHESR